MNIVRAKSITQLFEILTPLVAVAAFIGAYVYYFNAADIGTVGASDLRNSEQGSEFFFRVLWFVSAIATSLGALLVAVISVRITAGLLSQRRQIELYAACSGALVLVITLLYFHDMGGGAGQALLSRIDGGASAANISRGKVDAAVESTMTLAVISIFFLMVSACAIIAKSQREIGASILANLFHQFRMSMLGTSGFLVIGTLNIAALYQWAISVPSDEVVAAKVADALGVAGGAIYTVIMLAIYIPVSVFLNRQMRQSREREVASDDPEDVERWLKRYGFNNSPARVAFRFMLLAAPMIAGAVIDALLT